MSERARLTGDAHEIVRWRRWGPYLADRAWGTVREDYSADSEAWAYLPHDLARSKAYRWGEDGIAGFCDRYQVLCWAMAFWNERDPILKERFFGLIPTEGNHGEDVKECYFYVDALPSHAYQRMLYKYPQRAFPYRQLIEENERRGARDPEFELIDTGIFDDQRYFDIEIEIAKEDTEAIVFRITAHNRGPERAPLHLIPHLWFRNTWSWTGGNVPTPVMTDSDGGIAADDSHAAPLAGLLASTQIGPRKLQLPPEARTLFTENETHMERVFGGEHQSRTRYVKDAFHRAIVNGESDATNPENIGTKACGWLRVEIEPGASHVMRMRLAPEVGLPGDQVAELPGGRVAELPGGQVDGRPGGQVAGLPGGQNLGDNSRQPGNPATWQPAEATRQLGNLATGQPARLSDEEIDRIFDERRKEADEFYASVQPPRASEGERNVQRQAFAGMIWSKQSYLFDVDVWLDGDNPDDPPPASRQQGRNAHWRHLNSMRVLSMPDKWEYPWFAAWDLAFQAVVFALIDAEYAKEQLWLMVFEQFQHPNGQIPAYEWEFSDLNPPVHAWAVWRVYNMDRIRSGKGDLPFLEKCFHKLLLNFTWWVNKVDREGNNVFEGGFLGLDNITVFDRSEKLPGGAVLEQSDATGWMGMFCLVMMRMALELAKSNHVYEGLATKFFEHYVYIGAAMKMVRYDRTLWDEEDGFFYDLLRFPDGAAIPFRVRSLVGLIPLYAIERLERSWIEPFRVFHENLDWFVKHRRVIVESCVTTVQYDHDYTHVLAVVDQNQLQHLLSRIVDPDEFLSPAGIRSMSKFHQANPFTFGDASVSYEPAEAVEKLKGGNSNWRGPVWFPTSFLMIESLRKLEKAFGREVQVTFGDEGDTPVVDPSPMADTRADDGIGAVAAEIRARGMTLSNVPVPAPDRTVSLTGLAARIADRMIHIFLPDRDGYRPVYGPRGTRKAELFAHDPHWKDLVLFHEYFNGDTGEGLGASHQTGWTGLVANLVDEWRR